ncbi:MAG: hypothetical protein JSS90_09290 [Bacteroidetes bacterium]|jgi:hypothetical protein|nr:hypothetical protein [Bacteroidota bacterium]
MNFIRKFISSILLLHIVSTEVSAQKPDGVYQLRGVQDLSSAFKFNPDNTFEFYFIYGAVDRFAKGTYAISNDTIKLYSEKKAGDDFEIIEQSMKGKTYKVIVRDENAFLTQKVKAITYFGELRNEYEANEDGEIDINTKNCEKIYLQHELFPDVSTLIKDELNANTYFEVKLKPSLQEVSFQASIIRISGDTIICNNTPLFPAQDVRYVRE